MNEVEQFEQLICDFYGADYGVATDCCTHAIELCLRYLGTRHVTCPNHTYLSVPMTFKKLDLSWNFTFDKWQNYYSIGNTNIVDSAVYWKQNSYIPDTLMCLSFQHKKHLSLGRGGMILCNNALAADSLKKMSYDGRLSNIPWAEQDIEMLGYHYYMTPETAKAGIEKFHAIKNITPKQWSSDDYPDLTQMKVFKNAT